MIVKVASYTRVRRAAKATIRYIMHRPDRVGKRASRALFNGDGLLEKYLSYVTIDGMQKGSVFFRIAFSPGPLKEDTFRDLDLRRMTQLAMEYLKEKLGKDMQFFASVHDDQTDIRHVNALLLMPGRLTKAEFRLLPKLLREAAFSNVWTQRRELDQSITSEQARWYTAKLASQQSAKQFSQLVQGEDREYGTRSRPYRPTCIDCGPQQRLWRMDDGAYKCPECDAVFDLEYTGGLQREGMQLSI